MVFAWIVWVAAAASVAVADTPLPEAVLVIVGDQHSAYERTAQFVARVDRVKRENPGVPLGIVINGDALEFGNVVARRTAGAIDFAMFAALAQRAPTILNLGNHEPEFFVVAETVKRLEATGVRVISGNLRNPATGRTYAPASVKLKLGDHEATVVGVTTDLLSTYRVAIRPQLDLANPAVWAKENLPALLRETRVPIVVSHAGLGADRAILRLVPAGALFAGAHDHLQFVHHENETAYVHSGSWMSVVSIARLQRRPAGLRWEVEQVALTPDDPGDPALAKRVRETLAQHLTAQETAIVGRTSRELGPADAARFAVEAARTAAKADVALIGATTFGAGLPRGDVSRFAFDACVRFDGTLWVAEIEGAKLRRILARANQGPATPFAARAGENLIAVFREPIVAGRTYRFVTSDWVSKNAEKYLGEDPPALTELPELRLKAAVISALQYEPARN